MHYCRYGVVGHFQTSQGAHKLSRRGISIASYQSNNYQIFINHELCAEISNSELYPSIILANSYFINQFSLDGTREQTLFSDPRGGIWAVDYHYRWFIIVNAMVTNHCLGCNLYRMGRLFWSSTSNRAIMMSNLDGSQPRPLLNQELYSPRTYSMTCTLSLYKYIIILIASRWTFSWLDK